MTALDAHERSTSVRSDAPAPFHHGRCERFNAWFFTAFDPYIRHITRPHKHDAFRAISSGTIVEIGAGVGANLDHVPLGSRLIAIEPSHAMHDGLRRRASERGLDVEVLADDAHALSLPDGSVDEVLCSLVLCTVAEPDVVLAEIRRVLRAGGHLRFVEHVAAPRWSPRRWLQHAVRRPWSWVFDGCDTCRDTESAIRSAGFTQVVLTRRRLRHSLFVPVNTAIHGIATN